jgi:hypothetical protein
MGWFDNTLGAIGGLFEEAGAAVGDVVEDIGTAILGPAGTRGATLGAAVGSRFGAPEAGAALGASLSRNISAAPQRARQLLPEDVAGPVTQQDYNNIQALRDEMDFAAQQPTVNEGTVLDIRYPSPPVTAGLPRLPGGVRISPTAAIGAGMDFIDQITDYFAAGDDNLTQQNMMCRPAARRPYTINQQTGCISITRKQQAKLKELVRNVGIEIASKQIGLPISMVTQLLLKTFRTRRRGISGADLRTVKRVDRQMHSLACALGGISTTSRAVAARKAPPKRSC